MNNAWNDHFDCQLQQLQQQQLLRQRGNRTAVDYDPCWLDFGSNDYLGLSRSFEVIGQFEQAVDDVWGSGGSPVLSGYGESHQQLEMSLARLCGTENAMVFSSGYACNVGVLAGLADADCVVFSDQLNHASLIDGLRLGRAQRVIYFHCDLQSLEQLLECHRSKSHRALIVTESVFSMDGDEAPLIELANLADQFDCGLVVDEAHATGVFGNHGGGLLEELGISDRALVKLGTLSKAIGGIGGFAAGSNRIIEYLVNRCRSYIFSTALPKLAAQAATAAIGQLSQMQDQRQHLVTLACNLREQLTAMGWKVLPGRSPIVPVIIGDADKALELSLKLRGLGIYVPAIRPPTVPADTCRLRISLTARHRLQDIDRLLETLGNCKS